MQRILNFCPLLLSDCCVPLRNIGNSVLSEFLCWETVGKKARKIKSEFHRRWSCLLQLHTCTQTHTHNTHWHNTHRHTHTNKIAYLLLWGLAIDHTEVCNYYSNSTRASIVGKVIKRTETNLTALLVFDTLARKYLNTLLRPVLTAQRS